MSKKKLFLGISLLLLTVLACSLFSKSLTEASPTQTAQPKMYLLNDALTLAAQTIFAETKTVARSVPVTKTPLATPIQPVHSPILPVAIAGEHHVAMGETLSCIGRGYGVLPKAIADANGIGLLTKLQAGQILLIPRVQWSNISTGPICPPQFPPPFVSITATAVPPGSDQQIGDENTDDGNKEDDGQVVVQPPDDPYDPPVPEEPEDPFPTDVPPEDPPEIPHIDPPGLPPLPPIDPPTLP